jgi:uncharacterized Zn ribbon protein
MNKLKKSMKTIVAVVMMVVLLSGEIGDAGNIAHVYADTTVYVTRTGSKYHSHKCGNGTYYQSTLSAAKARGLSACKKCYGSNPPSSASTTSKKKTTSVTLNYTSEVLVVGKALKLKVKGSSSKIKWSSSNKKVAQVSKNGKVTAKKKGKTVITAEAGQKKLKCKIKVENPILSETSITLYEGETADIRLKGCSHDVDWESLDEDVAEVEDGEIFAWEEGNTTITAYVHGKTYKCKVVVLEEENSADY